MTISFSSADMESSYSIVEAYCPECVVKKYPRILDFSKIDKSDEKITYRIEENVFVSYSSYFSGFFGVKYKEIIFNPLSMCNFQTPFFEHCEKVPICLRGCKNISIFDILLKDDFCYAAQKCLVYNQEISEVIRYECSDFKK